MPRKKLLGDLSGENSKAILMVIEQIPRGKVATYGQVARLAGIPRNARQVGYVLRVLPAGMDLPWYRVVNSKGEISQRESHASEFSQWEALLEEGIDFNQAGRIPLKQFQWNPED